MTKYLVDFTSAAARQLRKIEPLHQRRLILAISALERDPRPSGTRKLSGEASTWRIRVGDYRIIYEIQDEYLVVTVIKAAHRRDVYE